MNTDDDDSEEKKTRQVTRSSLRFTEFIQIRQSCESDECNDFQSKHTRVYPAQKRKKKQPTKIPICERSRRNELI